MKKNKILRIIVFFICCAMFMDAHTEQNNFRCCGACNKNEKKELIIFPRIMAVLGNVGKILIDRNNKTEIIKQVDNMIDNIVMLVHEAARRSSVPPQLTAIKLMTYFLREIRNNSQLMKALNDYASNCPHHVRCA